MLSFFYPSVIFKNAEMTIYSSQITYISTISFGLISMINM